MADDQHEPQPSTEPGTAEPIGETAAAPSAPAGAAPLSDPATPDVSPGDTAVAEPVAPSEPVEQVEIVEAEIIETETVMADPVAPDPAAQASESLAAAAAASGHVDATSTPTDAPAGDAPSQWQLDDAQEPAPQYVVVEAPQLPRRRGNRGVGVLLALAGAVIFGGILVGVGWVLQYLVGEPGIAFLQDWHFYVPVAVFAIAFILLVVLVNRAGWWSYILGSVIVGLVVYFGTAGLGALLDEWTRSATPHTVAQGLQEPFVILAAIIAREVAVWWGSLIAMRGRRVTARNRAQREAYDRDLEEFRARYGG